jgi:anti-sigma-K factor RskA
MPNNDFLAFQYVLGLMDDTQKQALDKTPAFEKAVDKWQLQLHKLNTQAPLTKKSAKQVWQNINAKINAEAPISLTAKITKYWRQLIGSFAGLGLILSLMVFNQVAHAQLGWEIDTNLSTQKISIVATTHQHTDNLSACTLWVKKGDKILLIGVMPETGKKSLNITANMLAMIQGGEMIISLQDKKNSALIPSRVYYKHKWVI